MITYIELLPDVRSGGNASVTFPRLCQTDTYNISERLRKVYTLYAFLIISIYRLAAL